MALYSATVGILTVGACSLLGRTLDDHGISQIRLIQIATGLAVMLTAGLSAKPVLARLRFRGADPDRP